MGKPLNRKKKQRSQNEAEKETFTVHELLYTEIAKSGSIRLASGTSCNPKLVSQEPKTGEENLPGIGLGYEAVFPGFGRVGPQPAIHRLIGEVRVDPVPAPHGEVVRSLSLQQRQKVERKGRQEWELATENRFIPKMLEYLSYL